MEMLLLLLEGVLDVLVWSGIAPSREHSPAACFTAVSLVFAVALAILGLFFLWFGRT